MSDEQVSWSYSGRVALVGPQAQGVDRLLADVDLHIEVEREGSDALPLKSWCGTGRLVDARPAAIPVGQFAVVLPNGQMSEAYVNAAAEDGVISLDLQGVGAPPWVAA